MNFAASAVKHIVNFAQYIGKKSLTDITEDDVYELFDSHEQEPTVDELISMAEEQNAMAGENDDKDDESDAEEATRQLPTSVTLESCLENLKIFLLVWYGSILFQKGLSSSVETWEPVEHLKRLNNVTWKWQ